MITSLNLSPIHKLLLPLPQNQGAGIPVHLDYIYDQIKNAKRADDPQLSQGVWKTKLKTADWQRVIDLCEQTLTLYSKDLQICCWYAEALLALRGVETGGMTGLGLLTAFCEKFWPVFYPNALSVYIDHNNLDVTDVAKINKEEGFRLNEPQDPQQICERRQHIFDWLDKALTEHLLAFEFVPNDPLTTHGAITLSTWIDCLEYDKKLKKGIVNAKGDSSDTLDILKCRSLLQNMGITYVQGLKHIILSFEEYLSKLQDFLLQTDLPPKEQFVNTDRRVKQIIGILEQALEMLLSTLQKSHQKSNQDTDISTSNLTHKMVPTDDGDTPQSGMVAAQSHTVIISSREDAYSVLQKIGEYLLELEPHSPSPHLLQLIVSWENKSLLEIIQEIKNGKTEAHTLLSLLFSK